MYRAKYMVGQATSHITRVALTLGGAHGIFKGSRLEQLFRDGALAEIQPPPSDFCLWNVGLRELGLDPSAALPPMRPRTVRYGTASGLAARACFDSAAPTKPTGMPTTAAGRGVPRPSSSSK